MAAAVESSNKQWLLWSVLGFVFVIAALSVTLSGLLFFQIVPSVKGSLDKVSAGITQVTLATTKTVQEVSEILAGTNKNLQNVVLEAGQTMLLLQQGVANGTYQVNAVGDSITKVLEPDSANTVSSVQRGSYAGSSVMRHPSTVSTKRERNLPRWYRPGGHLTDHALLSSQAVDNTVRPRIHNVDDEITGKGNSLTVRHTSFHEAQLTWRITLPTGLNTVVKDAATEPLRLYFPDPILSGHTVLDASRLQDILVTSNINGTLVDVFYTAGNDYVEAWYRDAQRPVLASEMATVMTAQIQVHLLVIAEGDE
jgi:hypothetical protein